jgi:hypothetical protein
MGLYDDMRRGPLWSEALLTVANELTPSKIRYSVKSRTNIGRSESHIISWPFIILILSCQLTVRNIPSPRFSRPGASATEDETRVLQLLMKMLPCTCTQNHS